MKTLGQVNYETMAQFAGISEPWEDLTPRAQEMFQQSAINVVLTWEHDVHAVPDTLPCIEIPFEELASWNLEDCE